MLEEIKNIKSEKRDLRNFGIAIAIILLIIAGFQFWEGRDSFLIFFIVSIVLCIISVLISVVLKPIYWIWMVFATILGWVMTRVILSILFYIIITPIGLMLRLFGKQFLELKWDKSNSTYWNYRSKDVIEGDKYEKQF